MGESMITTLKINKKTLLKLKKMKKYKRQTYDELINEMMVKV
jgi:hypothetical protein